MQLLAVSTVPVGGFTGHIDRPPLVDPRPASVRTRGSHRMRVDFETPFVGVLGEPPVMWHVTLHDQFRPAPECRRVGCAGRRQDVDHVMPVPRPGGEVPVQIAFHT